MLPSESFIRTLKILCFMNILKEATSAKILAVFPSPAVSHQAPFRPLTQELARRGHEVTVITTDPAFPNGGAPENLHEINVHDISYQTFASLFQHKHDVKQSSVLDFSGIRTLQMTAAHILLAQLRTPEIKKLISDKNNSYDLLLIEACVRPALIFSYFFKAPVILVSSFGTFIDDENRIGAPTHPLLYPSTISKRTYNLTVTEKLERLYSYYSIEYARYLNEMEDNDLLRQTFGSNITPLSELYNNVDMLFLNVHPIWAGNRPMPPSVVYMGGIHQVPRKELPKNLKTHLDSAKHGVIYLSFGTNVLAGMIPQEKIKIFVQVLSRLPYDVLWKWDQDELPGKRDNDNIKISKWFPQPDLLRHPNVKLFITQAGLQSTDEAIVAGVPLVAVPMLVDQFFNAEQYVKHGIGKKLNIETVTAEEFKDAVESVINDESYRKNILRLRELIYDQPEPPLQRAVWWAEYVIKHGGAKQLRSPAANISYAKYFEFELLLILAAAFIIVLVMLIPLAVILMKLLKYTLSSQEKIKVS